jgi:hypothetical protein
MMPIPTKPKGRFPPRLRENSGRRANRAEDWRYLHSVVPLNGLLFDLRERPRGERRWARVTTQPPPFATASRSRIVFCYRMHLRTGRSQEISTSLQ